MSISLSSSLLLPKLFLSSLNLTPIGLEAVAPTLLYDAAAMGGETRLVPVERVAKVAAPTLIMDGEKSLKMYPFMRTTADALAQAMPNAERRTLKGQGHDVDAKVLAPVLVEFFS